MEITRPPSEWQAQLDIDFPHGMIMSWEGDDSRHVIGRLDVLGASHGFPLVRLDSFGVHKSLVVQVTGYTVVRTAPTLARVVGEDLPALMIWEGTVPDDLAQQIDEDDEDDAW